MKKTLPKKAIFLLASGVLALGGGSCARGDREIERILPSGVHLVVREGPRAEVISVRLFVKAGSINETDSTHGISRLTDQSMFRATETNPDVRETLQSYGVDFFSGITPDLMYFSATASSAFAEPILRIFTDVILHSTFTDSMVDRRKLELIPILDSESKNPRIQILNLFLQNAFRVHPYRLSPYGSARTIRRFDARRVERYYRNTFLPENITLVVTGQIDPKTVLRGLTQDLSGFERKPSEIFNWKSEIFRETSVRIVQRHHIPVPFALVSVGWPAPSIQNDDTFAMDVLLAILGLGQASRLNRQLRDAMPSVYSVWAQYLTPREPGYLIVTAVCDPAVADTVRGRILHEIRILRQDPVTAAELARAKEVFVAQRAFSQEGATDSAFLIGFWSVMKNAGFEDTYLRHIQSVQSNGIQEVARRYLNNNNSISIILLPERS